MTTRAAQSTTTFRDILSETASADVRQVVERAVLSSQIAKLANGVHSRRAAYAVKARAVEHVLAKFPDHCRFTALEIVETGDPSAERGVVGISFDYRRAVHLPLSKFTASGRAWVRRARKREVEQARRALASPTLSLPRPSISRVSLGDQRTVFRLAQEVV